MRVTLWGARGSVPAPGPETERYGGNTACVQARSAGGQELVLDAGSGIRRLGAALPPSLKRVDILLTHLHMDHILGLGFFGPLYNSATEVHVWGPPSISLSLRERLQRYLSPPLFPVHLRDLPRLTLHDLPNRPFRLGDFRVTSSLICHPGPTVGYRVCADGATLAYLPDHEPALGVTKFPLAGDWTSGYALAKDADLLIHDAQYTDEEYERHIGWGHSALSHTLAFAALAKAKQLTPFHHDPARSDDALDEILTEVAQTPRPFRILALTEGAVLDLP